ncbi:MAG: AMIN domain-containing protein [Gammaproteobacteria bacterium]|jgi:N-acetylmuramoyl-L-alanine amidase|nr:AMIN domain-containing protein [Gammaproteobacteria bacterium]
MLRLRFTSCLLILLLSSAAFAGSTVENVRIWSENNKTRVVLDLSRSVQHNIFTLRGPDRLVIDLKDSRLAKSLVEMPQGAGSVRAIRSAVRANGQLRVVLDLNAAVRSRTFTAGPNATYGDRLVIDLQDAGGFSTVKRASEAYRPGRDIVVAIDAGHGGHDPGSSGRRAKEKDIVLSISKELARRINAEPGMRALLIRDRDVFIDLDDRVDIAQRKDADLFISIHADAFGDSRANGASVFALNLDRADRVARETLSRRNRETVKVGDVSLNDKDPILASVLYDLSQSAALSASNDVGNRVSAQLSRVAKMHSLKVKEKSLAVLTSAEMPSILVETGFISNPGEEKKLRDRKYQARLANAILAGVRDYYYTNPPPDTRIAMDLKRQPARQVSYVVASGDTVSQIAERYNVSTADIRRANKLSSDRIRVGQKLSIPIFAGG